MLSKDGLRGAGKIEGIDLYLLKARRGDGTILSICSDGYFNVVVDTRRIYGG